ncbi:MAG TPA: gamma-glutamyl-gamma-aminobutyrate hydrolase family protein [Rhizomicrobium sp.]|jgi:putative glutamine amidotransferase|nr:gamma-glutamyl-gamma-aminobutyrate hydrolase family protein [Rhizomicrobium sp.]
MKSASPIVAIPCDRRMVGPHPFHMAGEKYITAVRDGANATPLLVPVLSPAIPADDILRIADGLFFTGSPSNVSPKLYGGPSPREGVLQDEHRDSTTMPLLNAAIEAGKPVFCVCRGFQELNVALGGTLHQHLQEIEGRLDHREDKNADLDTQYGPAHDMIVEEGGVFARLLPERRFKVNSLHSQGIDRLALRLRAEAHAPDGTIEAVSMPGAKGFLIAVQWHPEWKWQNDPVSRALFAAFGEALRKGA